MPESTTLERIISNYGSDYLAEALDELMGTWVRYNDLEQKNGGSLNNHLDEHYRILRDLRDIFRNSKDI